MNPIVRRVLRAFHDAGFEAYIVGGAVRDLLMQRQPHDYDVTTSARPEEIRALAEKEHWHTVEINGEAFGIVVLVVDGMTIDPSLPRKISSNPYVSRVRARFLQNNIHLRVKAVCQISCFAVHLWYKAWVQSAGKTPSGFVSNRHPSYC